MLVTNFDQSGILVLWYSYLSVLQVVKHLLTYNHYRGIYTVITTKVAIYKISDNEEFSSITYFKIITPILSNVIQFFIIVGCITMLIGFVQRIHT